MNKRLLVGGVCHSVRLACASAFEQGLEHTMTGFPVNADATMHHDGARPVSDRCALGAQRRGGSPTLPKRRFLDTLAAGLLLAIGSIGVWVITACAGGAHMAAPSVQLTGAVTSVEERGEPSVRAFSGPMIPLEPASTVSQRNAVRTAEDYLDYTAFSREGLIQQLEYEGFSTEDATFAVDHITVDWNEQAARAAEDYLDYSGFSRSGLIDQLEYDGFTPAQAAYGATAAGF
ncbi:hypothetical protein MSMEI_1228 [Mycolicibacterium smegmatis MC2 155]|nr:hypothetical protein MSMEI_1228 [Mycolicibacterium smegmatis MC2 155]